MDMAASWEQKELLALNSGLKDLNFFLKNRLKQLEFLDLTRLTSLV